MTPLKLEDFRNTAEAAAWSVQQPYKDTGKQADQAYEEAYFKSKINLDEFNSDAALTGKNDVCANLAAVPVMKARQMGELSGTINMSSKGEFPHQIGWGQNEDGTVWIQDNNKYTGQAFSDLQALESHVQQMRSLGADVKYNDANGRPAIDQDGFIQQLKMTKKAVDPSLARASNVLFH